MQNKLRNCAAVFMAFALLCVSSHSFAQGNEEVDNRIRRLENEIQTLSRAVFRGDVKQPPSSFQVDGASSSDQAVMANLNVRLSQLEGQLRQLTGQIEEQNFKLRQMETKLQQVTVLAQQSQAQNQQQVAPQASVPSYQDTTQSQNYSATPPNYTAQQMGQPAFNIGPNTDDHQLGSIRQTADGTPVVNTQNPTYMYDTAFAMLQQGDYESSARALTQFLATYSDHPLAANAQYWLGETYYVRNDFENAAKAFATGYQKYPTSAKAPDSLLKLALSFSNLNKNEEACVTLSQLQTDYPQASTTLMRKADEEKERLSCGNAD